MTKTRKMLSDMNAPYIVLLMRQIETQSKATLIRWAMDYSEKFLLPVYTKLYPGDSRLLKAIDAARNWNAGIIKLPRAKKEILACHEAARESEGNPAAQAAARAIAQAASTIHSPRHSIGMALYGALAIAYDALGSDAPWDKLEERAAAECGNMLEALRDISIENEKNPAEIEWKC